MLKRKGKQGSFTGFVFQNVAHKSDSDLLSFANHMHRNVPRKQAKQEKLQEKLEINHHTDLQRSVMGTLQTLQLYERYCHV